MKKDVRTTQHDFPSVLYHTPQGGQRVTTHQDFPSVPYHTPPGGPRVTTHHDFPSNLYHTWADAHADLSLHWVHMSFRWFCHAVAQM